MEAEAFLLEIIVNTTKGIVGKVWGDKNNYKYVLKTNPHLQFNTTHPIMCQLNRQLMRF